MKNKIIAASLLVGSLAYGQIKIQTGTDPSIGNQNPFLDASGYINSDNNVGKGLYFPTTDLKTWEFKTDLVNPGNFSNYFDGMIVYNTGEGTPTTEASKGGIRKNLTRGFYYFKNPNQTFPSGSVANGEWVRISDAQANDQLWINDSIAKVAKIKNLSDGTTERTDDKNIFVTDKGYVGIGTVNPLRKFHVEVMGDKPFFPVSAFFAPELSVNNSTHISIGKNNNLHNNGSIDFLYRGDGSELNGVGINTTKRTLSTNEPFILFAQANGNVGIGTNNPEETLDVIGRIRLKGHNSTRNSVVVLDAYDRKYALNGFRRNNSNRWDVGMDSTEETGNNSGSNYYMVAYQDDGTTRERVLTILRSNGNVGMGTVTPTEKLEVAGKVKATAFIGTNGASIFPDYVFQKYYTGTSSIKADYSFKTLSQVEDFVKANGYLPGYQSADAIKKQGYIDLMATQLTNVEKIEELYLHSIEQEKKIEAQQKQIEELKSLVQELLKK
ncbi:hypothetical protein PG614_04570 [Riemerella anatipestifer]|nr:hypothetical protein [Riemerella anatipestifer]MDY3533308.1 hypothetical protein [Riemerella anatipestifer]MDY3535216.1 hypothetical protein [Riemerella anatipestifer]